MPRRTTTVLSAATIVAAFWLSGCTQPGPAGNASTAVPAPVSSAPAAQATPLPDPVVLTDLLARLADPAVPGAEKLPLVQGATATDTPALDNFARALQDSHLVPLIFTATGLAWSDRDPGNVVATVAASGPDPKAAGFSFPMEFSPEGGGWQLSRRTADMLLVFGDSAATPTTPPR